MNLKSLYIKEYKNIQRGVLEFSNKNYTALVGANGSGKSNWVEAVAAVMCHLIEGQVSSFEYRLRLDDEKLVMYEEGKLEYKDGGREVEKETLDLPKRLIVCYSGEDHRLWESLLIKSYAKYFGNNQMMSVEEPAILYVNRYHWAAALITLLCSEQEEVKAFVKELWGEEIPLDKIKVKVDIDDGAKGYKDENAIRLLETFKQPELYIRAIKTTNLGIVGDNDIAKCRRLYYLLYALSMPVKNTDLDIKMQKAIKSIEIETDKELSLTNLSEGHKKRILMMLMTRILGDENTMFLLDEPDAHVDVTAKSKILKLIETAKGHVLMTTHSPILTSMMKPEAVETVTEGFVDTKKWSEIVTNLSDNKITTIDNFLFTIKKKVFITEGKCDIAYIRRAIDLLKNKEPRVQKLDEVASFCLNGAGGVDFFLKHSLLPVVDYFDKMVFIFDNDQAGKDAKGELDQFLNSNKKLKPKISSILYADIYTRKMRHDFLVEDYFPDTCYKGKDDNIPEFNINGFPKFNEIKKMKAAETAIKDYIWKHYKEFDANAYNGFLPLLDKIISELAL